MGNVACCKKPNEIIEDKDLLKKSLIKQNINFEKDIYEEKEKQDINNNINIIEDHNQLIDLEKNNLELQSTIGPSDNLRNRRKKQNQDNNYQNSKNDYYEQNKTINTENNKNKYIQPYENIGKEEIINTNINNNNFNIYSKQRQMDNQHINERLNKSPLDWKKNNYSNEINKRNIEYDNIRKGEQNENNQSNSLTINQSIEFINNSNYVPRSSSPNESKVNFPQNNHTHKNKIIDNNYQLSKINNNEIKEEIPQNTIVNQSNHNLYQQKIIQSEEYQQEDSEEPKDSNEVYQRPITNQLTLNNKDNNEDDQTKEAYIQNPNGQIFPTQQISEVELADLYKQCLSKGKTESDEDFSIENYKKFYPENDPFFNYDKGEVSQGQIITSPEDIDHLEIYEGEINQNNKKHGFGIATTALYVRKGTWRNGEFTGWCRESRRNRDVLEGRFENGLVNGKGFLKNVKGNLYVGDFVNSLREGFGELYTNRIHYIGQFKEDKLNGRGVIEFLKEEHKYEGEFKNNEINGKGIFTWKNGDIYEGEMKNGKMNGRGTYKYVDGQIYDGEYINGIKEGKGRIILSNKVIYEGEFRGGYRYEHGKIIDSNLMILNDNVENNNIKNKMKENYDNNVEYPQD